MKQQSDISTPEFRSRLAQVVGEENARFVMQQLRPVLAHLQRNETTISLNKRIIKMHKKAARKRRRAMLDPEFRAAALRHSRAEKSRRSMGRTGYSNGFDLTAGYSPYPFWHGRPGRKP